MRNRNFAGRNGSGSDGTRTRVIRQFDPATVKEFMGHSKLTTTERYLHARPRRGDAARMTQAFSADEAFDGVAPSADPA
jgi:integrase